MTKRARPTPARRCNERSRVMNSFTYAFTFAALLGSVSACLDEAPADDEDTNLEDADDKADTTTPTVTSDQLNGMWHAQSTDAVIESWTAIGIRLHVGDKIYP